MKIQLMLIEILLLFSLNKSIEMKALSSPVSSSPKICHLEHNGKQLIEGESLEINGKIHKVEECSFNRAYNACGTHLFYMLNIVCRALDQNSTKSTKISRGRRFSRQKTLTDACCQSVCTVSEMTRYCP